MLPGGRNRLHASKKESSSLFFEKQLEYLDDGIADKVDIPQIDKPKFIGMECVDKVTGFRGIEKGIVSQRDVGPTSPLSRA